MVLRAQLGFGVPFIRDEFRHASFRTQQMTVETVLPEFTIVSWTYTRLVQPLDTFHCIFADAWCQFDDAIVQMIVEIKVA